MRSGQAPLFRTAQPTILTWGLLGPGKGIEWGIDAMASLTICTRRCATSSRARRTRKCWCARVRAYRARLIEQVNRLAVTATVSFDSRNRHEAALAELIDIGRCRAPPIRLHRSGDLRCAHRGGCRPQAGDRYPLPARGRAGVFAAAR